MKFNITSLAAATALILSNAVIPWSQAQAEDEYDVDRIKFPLVRPAVLGESCLPNAKGIVKVRTRGNTEIMDLRVKNMPPNTEFDVFVIQVPNFPFGMSWYQGDLQTKWNGKGYARFVGRFNEETFIVAPGTAPAPFIHDQQIADAVDNPATAPIHTYHIGIWFNSPEDAVKAGCPGITTPFNGEHNAGIQILNTSNFPDEEGPLLQLKP